MDQMIERNVMIDIETLSKRHDAAVLSIGLAAFDLVSGVTDVAEFKIDMEHLHGHVDPETVRWWMGQSDDARSATFGKKDDTDRVHPFAAAMGMADFIDRNGGYDDTLVWANSPSFDITILKWWWENMPAMRGRTASLVPDRRFPVFYRNERDCRTLFALGRRLGVDTSDCWTGIAHSAAGDACNQARAVARILQALKA